MRGNVNRVDFRYYARYCIKILFITTSTVTPLSDSYRSSLVLNAALTSGGSFGGSFGGCVHGMYSVILHCIFHGLYRVLAFCYFCLSLLCMLVLLFPFRDVDIVAVLEGRVGDCQNDTNVFCFACSGRPRHCCFSFLDCVCLLSLSTWDG